MDLNRNKHIRHNLTDEIDDIFLEGRNKQRPSALIEELKNNINHDYCETEYGKTQSDGIPPHNEVLIKISGDNIITHSVGEIIMSDNDTCKKMIDDIKKNIEWLSSFLYKKNDAADKDYDIKQTEKDNMCETSSMKIEITKAGSIIIRSIGWQYRISKIAFLTNFTEAGEKKSDEKIYTLGFNDLKICELIHKKRGDGFSRLNNSTKLTSDGWGDEKWKDTMARDILRLRPVSKSENANEIFDIRKFKSRKKCHEELLSGFFKLTQNGYDSSSRLPNSAQNSNTDHERDIENRNCSFPYKITSALYRYYSKGFDEYIRVEQVDNGDLIISNRNISQHNFGTVFFSYQYDNINRHTPGILYSKQFRNNGMAISTRAECSFEVGGTPPCISYYSGFSVGFIGVDFLGEEILNKWQIDPYFLKSIIGQKNVANGQYATLESSGVRASLTLSSKVKPPGMYALNWRCIDGNDATRLISRSIPIPNLMSGCITSYIVRIRGFDYLNIPELWSDVSLHADEVGTNLEIRESYESPFYRLRLWGLIHNSRPSPTHIPIDELYNIGGYFPFNHDFLSRDKHVDYIGSAMGTRWGFQLWEASFMWPWWPSKTFWNLELFTPGAKGNIQPVGQCIGYASEKYWTMTEKLCALGFAATFKSPSMSAFQLKTSIAAGWEILRNWSLATDTKVLPRSLSLSFGITI